MFRRRKIQARNYAIEICGQIVGNKDKYLIIDTQTTGIEEDDVIVHIGITDISGNILMDTFIKPADGKRICEEASEVNGITMKMVSKAPRFSDIQTEFSQIIENKTLVAYNAEFDARMIKNTAIAEKVLLKDIDLLCAMKANKFYTGSDHYTYLKGGDHTSIGNCLATLKLISKIAKAKKEPEPKWWQFYI